MRLCVARDFAALFSPLLSVTAETRCRSRLFAWTRLGAFDAVLAAERPQRLPTLASADRAFAAVDSYRRDLPRRLSHSRPRIGR